MSSSQLFTFSHLKKTFVHSHVHHRYTHFFVSRTCLFLFYLFLSHACALWLSHHIILSSFQKISFFYHLIHRPSEYSIVYNGSDTQLEDAVSISQTYFDKSCVSFLFFFLFGSFIGNISTCTLRHPLQSIDPVGRCFCF